MNLEPFLDKVAEIAEERPSYRLGGDGSDGTCDCIGLIIGAMRRAGGAWPGLHGSNYAARQEVEGMREVTGAEGLRRGEAVFKARKPKEAKYALPKRYQSGADKRDYYHVGVVVSASPLEIVHCTGPGIVRDHALGKWRYAGWLRRVTSETEAQAPMVCQAVVATPNGGAVKLRAKPTKKCGLYWEIPCGERVAVLAAETGSAGWWQVQHGGRIGYILETFLHKED